MTDIGILNEATDEELALLVDKMLKEGKDKELERASLAAIAKDYDDAKGFAAFYELIHGIKAPAHALAWIEQIYEARADGKGVVIEAFRGSTKTTIVTITFTAWRIGKEPHRANLLIQVGDDIANDNSSAVADIIANHEAWKLVFPEVEPDREMGWGAAGYEVKRTDIGYSEWRKKNSDRKDPTLIGVSYKSRAIIGKHPDGVLVVDDIHDENNTSSERELQTVRNILTGTIFPTEQPDTWSIFIGTPWVENDCLGYVANTGEYVHIKTPVFADADDDDTGGEYFEGRWVKLAWEEKFNAKEIARQKNKAGMLQFARMFLLDLTAAQNRVFKYQTFPASEVNYKWVMVGGCDYASSGDEKKNKEGRLDYFALCYLAKLPQGGAVIVDGVLAHCTQAEAEVHMNKAQAIFPMWQSTMVESSGKGDDFIQVISRNPMLRIIPQPAGKMKKERRLEMLLGPWLENGAVRISDADTPFLVELRKELDNYPFHSHDDAMDAMYYAMRNAPDVLVFPDADEAMDIKMRTEEEHENPFATIGRYSR